MILYKCYLLFCVYQKIFLVITILFKDCYALFIRLPAKYLDPVTQLPYCNIATFRILREAYYQQLEIRGDRGSPEIAAWLAYRQAAKEKQIPRIRIDPGMLQLNKLTQ